MRSNRRFFASYAFKKKNQGDAADAKHTEKAEIKNKCEELRLLLQLEIEQMQRLHI